MELSGLATEIRNEMQINKNLELNWAIVKDWNESSRYESEISEAQARNLYAACTARKDGVLNWIKRKW
jgi:hypothetical protein